MAVDLTLVALLSGVEGAWLWAGLALVVLQLRSRRTDKGVAARRQWVGWLGAALLAALALGEAWSGWQTFRHPTATETGHRTDAAAKTGPGSSGEEDDSPAAPAGGASTPAAQAARIAGLEQQLAAARRHEPMTPRKLLDELVEAVGASFGWGIVYFSLLPAWWGGQTVGKKLFGLKVVELTGKPMTVMLSLRRYGGYAAGLATGGLGFVGLLWDANRQALHDKAAHTVVIDLRPGPATDVVAEADAARVGHRPVQDR
jgi:hypothetical protein